VKDAGWMIERLRRAELFLDHRGPGSQSLSAASIDSRGIEAGQLFFALPGERTDGHRFAAEALDRGAGAVLSEPERFTELAARHPDRDLFLVRDVLDALQILAAARVGEVDPWILGVTGSNGKTGTKNYCAAALATLGKTVASPGNLNNLIGLPLAFFDLPGEAEYLVAEMGCSGYGEIARLCELFPPEGGVVTNIGEAHLEQLHDRKGVLKAKSELADALPPSGILIVNGDDDYAFSMSVVTAALAVRAYGFGERSDLRLEDLGREGAGRRLRLDGRELHLRSPLRHSILQAGAAWLIGRSLGADLEALAEALEAVRPERNRGGLYRLGAWILLDDSYNANPDSLRAALEWLLDFPCRGRRWAVLGDMLELGEGGARAHEEFGRGIAERGGLELLCLGALCAGMATAAREMGLARARHFDDHAALASALLERLAPGDIILVKGSRGMEMEKVIEALESATGLSREAVQ